MKSIIYIISFLVFILLTSTDVSAQKKCRNYLEKKCDGYGPPYKFSGQSRSADFEIGKKSSFKVSAFGGFEYCVSLCATKNLKGVYFNILEDTPEKTVLYSGQSDDTGMNQKEFKIEDSKRLIIEVVAPESDKDLQDMDYDDINGCVGVVIEYHKIGNKGF